MMTEREITVNVTETHIEKGIQGDCFSCPIALALHDAGYPNVRVARTWVVINPDDPELKAEVSLPHKATMFIDYFDGNCEGSALPFSFSIQI